MVAMGVGVALGVGAGAADLGAGPGAGGSTGAGVATGFGAGAGTAATLGAEACVPPGTVAGFGAGADATVAGAVAGADCAADGAAGVSACGAGAAFSLQARSRNTSIKAELANGRMGVSRICPPIIDPFPAQTTDGAPTGRGGIPGVEAGREALRAYFPALSKARFRTMSSVFQGAPPPPRYFWNHSRWAL